MTIVRAAVVLLVLTLCFGGPTFAGKNAGGALVVHAAIEPLGSWCYMVGYCQDGCFEDPGTCEAANTQSDRIDPQFLEGEVVWVFAAFPEGSSPGVRGVTFGIDHTFAPGFLADWRPCGPENTLETPDAGWPNNWQNAGNTVTFGSPITDEHFFMFYYFACYGEEGDYIGTGINPTLGYAGFMSDDVPAVFDGTGRFGRVRWLEPGFNDCPEPLVLGACCFEDGSCEPLYEYQCVETGGDHWLTGTLCDPNPCVPSQVQEPNYEVRAWGAIKAQYR